MSIPALLAESNALRVFAALAATVALAAVPARGAPSTTLGYDDARHLLARTGFGPTDTEVRAYARLSRADAVDELLRGTRTTALSAAPAFVTTPLDPPPGEQATVADRQAFVRRQVGEGLELRGWWLREMVTTPSPLTERMTLFWHNHFVSAQPKVRLTRLMYRQNVVLRANALGDFGTLLHALARDPAMLVYLDGVRNRAGAPNENFAREVMELFTLGEGHYTEQDVKEAARAFTGWSVRRDSGDFVVRPLLHDDGRKTIFGVTGRYDGDDVLDLLLARPETAIFVTTKLWREFVSPDPDRAEVARIAARFRDSRYDIKGSAARAAALRRVLGEGESRRPREVAHRARRGHVAHARARARAGPAVCARTAAGMGQNLFSPPNVRGWPGADTWINTTTLLARKQFIDRVMRGDTMAGRGDTMAARGDAMSAAAVSDPRPPDVGNATSEPATSATMEPTAGAQAATAPIADEKLRRQRLAREMERGIASLHFDSARFVAQLRGATAAERAAAGQRLLLPVEPQRAVHPAADAPALVRSLVLDPAYQLK